MRFERFVGWMLSVSALGCGLGDIGEPGRGDPGKRTSTGGPGSGGAPSTTSSAAGSANGGATGSAAGSGGQPPAGTCTAWSTRCEGRACGDDGFSGTCGDCPATTHCSPEGQCVACAPSCNQRVCGDDGCGQSCGTCAAGQTCSVGECIDFALEDRNELESMYYVNEFRTKAVKYDSGNATVYGGLPRPDSCTTNPALDVLLPPARLNADMVENARRTAQHILRVAVDDPSYNLCQHYDPVDMVGSLGNRIGTYLGMQGCQNIWCGFVAPQDAPITGDPGHCECMLYGENDWGIGAMRANGPGIQVQDPATDSAYLAVILDNERPATDSGAVSVYVPAAGFRGLAHLEDIVEVQLSEDPCFAGATWQPYSPTLTFDLSPGDGRKVVWGRVKDSTGATAVSWDSIYRGPEPAQLDALAEGIRRVRSVRLPRLEHPGFDHFVYGLGEHLEMEDEAQMGLWWGTRTVVADPDASMGKAVTLDPGGLAYFYTGGNGLAPMEGEIHVRMKAPDVQTAEVVANATWREDSGGPIGGLAIKGTDFGAANTYQWFRIPFHKTQFASLIYFEFSAGPGVLVDRFDIYSKAEPTSITEGAGTTLDFSTRNYRGIEVQIRFVKEGSHEIVDGPRINPYCPLCAG